MTKIIVGMIGQDVENFIVMALQSVLPWCDAVVYLDGGSRDQTLKLVSDMRDDRITVIQHFYDQKDPMMNGKQRNRLLNYLKEHHMGDWCLVIDPDEVVSDDGYRFREIMLQNKEIFNVQMRHVVYHFGLEDATVEKHWTLGRLFKIIPPLFYPEIEHPVLNHPSGAYYNLEGGPVLWHLSLAKQMFDILKKNNKDNVVSTNTHNPEFLRQWYMALAFGTYPVKKIEDVNNYPTPIKRHFKFEQ